jgi:tripartite-type tricarboxylate transporter receptor subunit TctC
VTDLLVVRRRLGIIVRCVVLGGLCLILWQPPALAQSAASRPIRLLMPYAPGSGWDAMIRVLAQAVGEKMSKTIVVDNRPGANTIVGANACKNADPDGTTICVLSTSSMMLNPLLYKNLSYRPREDFEPITLAAFVDHVIIMHRSVPAKNLHEVVAYSKANPDKLNFGSNGTGADLHLVIEWLKNKTGAKLQHIPYRGIGPAMLAFEAGEIQLLALTPGTGSLVERVNSGDITALLVDSDERLPILPNVPTLIELGMPRYKLRGWLGLFAPAGTPKDVVASLNRGFSGVIKDPEFQKRHLLPFGFWPDGSSPEALAQRMVDTQEEAAELVRLSGVKPE